MACHLHSYFGLPLGAHEAGWVQPRGWEIMAPPAARSAAKMQICVFIATAEERNEVTNTWCMAENGCSNIIIANYLK